MTSEIGVGPLDLVEWKLIERDKVAALRIFIVRLFGLRRPLLGADSFASSTQTQTVSDRFKISFFLHTQTFALSKVLFDFVTTEKGDEMIPRFVILCELRCLMSDNSYSMQLRFGSDWNRRNRCRQLAELLRIYLHQHSSRWEEIRCQRDCMDRHYLLLSRKRER